MEIIKREAVEKLQVENYLRNMFSLEAKTAIVTGAAGGIGSVIAEALACSGAYTILCDIDMENLGKIEETIRKKGGNVQAFKLDVTDTNSVDCCVQKVATECRGIDILINCAGVNKREGLMDVEEETYDRIMNINLKGVFRVSRAVAPYMKKRSRGSIINIGSHNTGSILGGCSVYGATKCGVVSLTRSMAVEWAKYNIRANCVSPGHIKTELTVPTWKDQEKSRYLLERIALARPGYPGDVAGICVFLASDASSYITGEEIRVDGGCICGGQPWAYNTQF